MEEGSTTGRKWTVKIPQWRPPSKNESRNRHFKRENRLKTATTNMLIVYIKNAQVPEVGGSYRPKRRVSVRVIYPTQRGSMVDPPNLVDILYDAMKRARIIVDDSEKWLDAIMPTVERGDEFATYITIEDI